MAAVEDPAKQSRVSSRVEKGEKIVMSRVGIRWSSLRVAAERPKRGHGGGSTQRSRKVRRKFSAVAGITAVLVASGYSPAGASTEAKPVTLSFVLQGPLTGTAGALYKNLVTMFHKRYPQLTVKLIPEAEAQIEDEALTVVKEANPPDMIYWPVGAGYGETTAAELGLLANVLPLYKQEGWLKVMPANMVKEEIRTKWAPSGGLYNVDGGLGAQPYVFYNKEIFAKYKLSPATSVAGLVSIAKTLKTAGVPALALGEKDGWPDVHLASILVERTLSYGAYNKLLYSWSPSRTPDPTSWTSPAVIKAFDVVAELGKAGLLVDGSTALSNDEAVTLFEDGKAAMVSCPVGCFSPQTIKEYIGSRFKVGMFQYPSIVPGIPLYQNVAVANEEFSIPEHAWLKEKGPITDWIKFTMSLAGRKELLDEGFLPDDTHGLTSAEITKGVGPFYEDVVKWIDKYGTEQNLDGWLAASQRTLLGTEMERLFAGSITPSAAGAAMQAITVKARKGEE